MSNKNPSIEFDRALADAIAGIRPLRLDDWSMHFLNSARGGDRVERKGERVDFRYDEERKMMYRESKHYNNLYTYIAKSSLYEGVYKIGRSSDIRERMKSLNRQRNIYGRLAFEPTAYYVGDIETLMLFALRPVSTQKIPSQFKGAEEVVFVTKADMDFVIDTVGFTRCSTNTLPSELTGLTKTVRHYYDNDGWVVERVEELSYVDYHGIEVRKKTVIPYLEEDEYLERMRNRTIISRALEEDERDSQHS